jgi:ADP-ribosylglycohydrolase
MISYGTHHQPPGTWSDDTSLTLCLVESLAEAGYDPADAGKRVIYPWPDSPCPAL